MGAICDNGDDQEYARHANVSNATAYDTEGHPILFELPLRQGSLPGPCVFACQDCRLQRGDEIRRHCHNIEDAVPDLPGRNLNAHQLLFDTKAILKDQLRTVRTPPQSNVLEALDAGV